MARKIAVIDIGTNSIKFCMAETNGAEFRVIEDLNDITRLGEGLSETGKIKPEVLERNARAVENFVKIARENGASEILSVGTMALRSARNASEFCGRVAELCGLDVKIISGDEEARLSFAAASPLAGGKNCFVFDVGGGSTELIFGRGKKIIEKQSFNIGAVSMTETLPPSAPPTPPSEREALRCSPFQIAPLSEGGCPQGRGEFLIGVGGAATTVASVKLKLAVYDAKKIHGTKITIEELESQITLYERLPLEERKKIVGLPPARADIILAGARIIKSIMECLDKKEFWVSDEGLRHALLREVVSFIES